MTTEDAILIGDGKLANHGLWELGWKTVIDYQTMRRLGCCRYGAKEIGLSAWYVKRAPVEDVVNTILHEIAHALTPNDGHGFRWRQTCLRIGAKPERLKKLGPEFTSTMPFVATCETCNQEIGCHRIPRGVRVCSRCRRMLPRDSWRSLQFKANRNIPGPVTLPMVAFKGTPCTVTMPGDSVTGLIDELR